MNVRMSAWVRGCVVLDFNEKERKKSKVTLKKNAKISFKKVCREICNILPNQGQNHHPVTAELTHRQPLKF